MRHRRWAAPAAAVVAVAAAAALTAPALVPPASAAPVVGQAPGSEPPMVTLLFSRSEMGDASDCSDARAPDTVWLGTTVAPELRRRGLHPTGSLETTTTQESSRACLHYGRTLSMSWDDAAYYRDQAGWSFVSAGRTRVPVTGLSDADLADQVEGSLQDLEDHGHQHASGLYAYQNNKYDDRTQALVRQYYDFGRTYHYPAGPGSVTTHAVSDPERLQYTSPAGGGHCVQKTPVCTQHRYTTVAYTGPQKIINAVQSLQPGEWLTIQSYVFVKGYRPKQWDCTSKDTRLHWTFDAERYCWSDYLRILDALAARPDVLVTDPWTVAQSWYPDQPPARQPATPTLRQ